MYLQQLMFLPFLRVSAPYKCRLWSLFSLQIDNFYLTINVDFQDICLKCFPDSLILKRTKDNNLAVNYLVLKILLTNRGEISIYYKRKSFAFKVSHNFHWSCKRTYISIVIRQIYRFLLESVLVKICFKQNSFIFYIYYNNKFLSILYIKRFFFRQLPLLIWSSVLLLSFTSIKWLVLHKVFTKAVLWW